MCVCVCVIIVCRNARRDSRAASQSIGHRFAVIDAAAPAAAGIERAAAAAAAAALDGCCCEWARIPSPSDADAGRLHRMLTVLHTDGCKY